MFVALSLDSILFALSFKNLHKPLWRISLLNNKWVFLGLGASMALLITAVTLPPLRALLSLTVLSVSDVLLLVFLGVLNLLTIEGVKWWLNRKS
jgi:magnesium-transporting ATPase (P-type)